jgi:DNA-binding NarL/FixJ family response regulator
MGAADATWRHAELWLPLSSFTDLRRAAVDELVARLSNGGYEKEFAAGARMSMDDAVREALEVEATQPRRPGSLTRREKEIAALVSDGLTSREIAARLVLSPRTVESHVDHILTKLGLRSRAQIATWWTRETA